MTSTTYRVGDPDPIDYDSPRPGGTCQAQSEPVETGPYLCTREADHEPPHVGGTGEKILAVWE